jgi:DNA-binding transcriptional LysR family regulator
MSSAVSWDDQRVFLAVLEEGSLSGAARRLNLRHPTVRARLEALESAIGTVLFTRSARGLVATEQAQELADFVRTMDRASDAFVRATQATAGEISGVIRLSTTDIVGLEVLPPIIAQLRQRYPRISVELALSDSFADVLDQEADIVVRMLHPPTQEGLLAQKIGALSIGLFAHVDYLARRGEPASLRELSAHDVVGPDRDPFDLALMARLAPELERRRLAFRTDHRHAHIAAARAGVGIAMFHKAIGRADPNLKAVLPSLDFGAIEMWLVTSEDLIKLPRIRAVFDHLVGALRAYVQ